MQSLVKPATEWELQRTLAEAARAEAEKQRGLLEEQKQIVAEIDQALAELAAASSQIEQELRALAVQRRGNLQPSQAWTGLKSVGPRAWHCGTIWFRPPTKPDGS